MEEEDHIDTNEENSPSPKQRKTRGPTTGLKAQKNQQPKHIRFDKKGRPIGAWRVQFASDLGVLARNIKITIELWKRVPEGQKETIWLDVKKKWNIKDEKKRKAVLKIVASRFKDFKSRLSSQYVFKTKKQPRKVQLDDPLSIHRQITKDDWKAFVKQRMEKKFRERSEKAKLAQKNNLHPHYMGRAGYVGKMDEWHDEEVKKELSKLQADSTITEETVSEIVTSRLENRGFTWMKGHTPKSRKPPPQTQELIDNIMHWEEQVEKGEFVPTRKEDVLVKATGKPDHPGRTRGVGTFVGLQAHFGKPTGRKPREKLYTADDVRLLLENNRRETLAEMKTIVNQQILGAATACGWTIPPEFEANMRASNSSLLQQQEHSSCHSADPNNDPFAQLKGPVSCRLAQYHGEDVVVVAEGMVRPWVEGTMVHGTPLTPQNAHVSIDVANEPTAPLPIPFSGFSTVGEIEGSYAQWPKSLIWLGDKGMSDGSRKRKNMSKDTKESGNKAQHESKSNRKLKKKNKSKETKESAKKASHKESANKASETEKVGQKQNVADEDKEDDGPLSAQELDDLGPNCKQLENTLVAFSLQSSDLLFHIKVNESVYNYSTATDVPLSFADIRQMFRYEWLNVSIIQLWGSWVYEFGTSLGRSNVGYMCPQRLSLYQYKNRELDMEKYVTNVMKFQEDKRYVMGAFIQGVHWMLVVICPEENMAFIFDSDQANTEKLGITKHLKSAWKVYGFMAGKHHPTKKNELVVKKIKCPQQPGAHECAYYVMKWMYDITLYYSSMSIQDFEKCVSETTMTTEDMDEVREIWSTKCMENI